MLAFPTIRKPPQSPRRQTGVVALVVTLSLLVILTLIVLASTNVALFEQKTTSNENRQRLADQAAEYALNLGGEFLQSNVANISAIDPVNGWLSATTGITRWLPCNGVSAFPTAIADLSDGSPHPCMAETTSRRDALYFYSYNDAATTDDTQIPYNSVATAGQLDKVGGSVFSATARVRALLCRLDTTVGSAPQCKLSPTTGNRIAITLIADSGVTGENAASQVKETWAIYNDFTATSAVPLVAAGSVTGLGNATIVASANAGGYGLAASIWSPQNVDVDASGAGVGSVSTCHMGEYLTGQLGTGNTPVSQLKTACAAQGPTCGCPADQLISGHTGAIKKEGLDVLDIDGNHGALPDIQFYPGRNGAGVEMDDPTDNFDDSLFEWIFGKNVVNEGAAAVRTGCTPNSDCAVQALYDMNATVLANCSSLSAASKGLYYITGACSLPAQVGSATNSAIVVVNGSATLNGTLLYGMLFVRSPNNTATMDGTGNSKVFGSVVVEGAVDLHGNIDLVYVDTAAQSPGDHLLDSQRFARLTGSWFDNRASF